jgi:hypothetical protein
LARWGYLQALGTNEIFDEFEKVIPLLVDARFFGEAEVGMPPESTMMR